MHRNAKKSAEKIAKTRRSSPEPSFKEVKALKKKIKELEHTLLAYRGRDKERALETEHLKTLAEHIPIGIALIAPDGTFTYINNKFKELFGYDLNEIPDGRTWFRKAYPDANYRHKVISQWVKDQKGIKPDEEVPPRIFTVRCKDGTNKAIHFFFLLRLEEGIKMMCCIDITEKQIIEEALKESEQKYHSIFENAMEGIFQTTPEGKIISCNKSYARIYGYDSPEEMIASVHSIGRQHYLYPEDRERWRRLMEIKGEVKGFEAEAKKRDGTPFWVKFNVRPIKDDKGKIIYYEGTIEDITDHKEAELTLKSLEDLEFSILSAIPHAVIGLRNRIIIFANKGVKGVFGYEPEELIGKNTRILYRSDEEYEEIGQLFYPVLERQKTYSHEFFCRRKDGKDILCRLNTATIGETLKEKQIVAMYEDVTEVKKSEEELQKEKELFFTTLEHNPNGIVLIDPQGKYFFVNSEFTRVTGYTLNDTPTGRDVLNKAFPDPAYRQKVISAWKEDRKKSGISVDRQFTFMCADGTIKELEIRTTFLEEFAILVLKDITFRVEAERALKEAEEKYRSIFEHAVGGIYQCMPEGRYLNLNPAFARMLGYDSPQEVIETITDIGTQIYVNPEDRNTFMEHVQKQGYIENFETRFRCKDGSIIWISTNARVVKDSTGKVLYFEGTTENITEGKKAEEALKEKEVRYRTLFENANDAIFLMKGDIFIECNPKTLEMFKCTQDQIIGKPPYLFSPPTQPDGRDSKEKALEKINTALKGKPQFFEWLHCHYDGTPFYTEVNLNRLDIGNEVYIQAMVRDIDERKKTEEVLRASEELYRTLIEASNDAIAIVKEGRHLFVNQRFTDLFGYSREEATGQPINFWIHPDNKEKVLDIAIKRENGEPVSDRYEFKGIRKDGSLVYVEVSASQFSMHGETMVLAILRDITGRKKAGEELKQERERFYTLLECNPFGIVMLDREGNFLYVNAKWKELFGYDLSEIPDGRTWFRKAYPDADYRHEVISTWINDIKDRTPGKRILRTFTAICKDETKKIVNFITVLLEKDKFFITCEDITEHKRTEEQLLQAQKMEAIGRLAGGIAHDFNNMLTVILGHTQLALLSLDSSHPHYQRFTEIQKAAQRSAELTRNLLAFARKQTIVPMVINFNSVVEDMSKMLKRLIGENIELLWIPGANLWPVKVDSAQLNQVIINLVINAKDAIPEYGKITIETENVVLDENYCKNHLGFTSGEYVMLAISDNGIGMGKEVLEHLFEPFFTTKGVDKGSGLGLSTVYGIIKQNNGFINAYSEPDKGSTFKIYMPRFTGLTEESKLEAVKDVMESKGETILVVEDEAEVLELCTFMLEKLGYKVLSAQTPHDAIKEAKDYEGEIHLLITDVVMPEMNGGELAEQLKTLRPSIRCLYMSGYTTNAIVHNGILKDNINYIQKPFTLHTLSAKLREILSIG